MSTQTQETMARLLSNDERLDAIAEAIHIIVGQLRQGSMGANWYQRLETLSERLNQDVSARIAISDEP